MKVDYTKLLLIICTVFVLISCSGDGKKEVPPIKNPVAVKLIRLEKQLFALKSKEETRAFLTRTPAFTRLYIGDEDSIIDDQVTDFMFEFYSNPKLKEFYRYTDSSFSDTVALRESFADLFGRVKENFPDFVPPVVYTVVTGFRFDKDIAISDSAVVISIDYFLGDKAPFRPNNYDYFLKRYDKPYMVPMIGLALSTKYNRNNENDKTMLASMIYYGKAHYFLEKTMPALEDSLNIMYSEKELKSAQENLSTIWAHFVERKLLYETSHRALENYVGESPATNEISKEAPGRIGRWLGWLIVREYMAKHPEVTLKQLMEQTDAQKIFKESGFRPEKEKK
ncbi:MAG: gldB [Cytophagaceae bacterium]|jgi:gliding motility-associated lipoprotein GldB|nr:gldB [Cytophagaceae bacterium]